jgi:hypothetical protein
MRPRPDRHMRVHLDPHSKDLLGLHTRRSYKGLQMQMTR